MERFFNINPTDMSDGSGRLYSIDTPEGERVGSCTSEHAARNPGACHLYGNTCQFFEVCSGIASIDDEPKHSVIVRKPLWDHDAQEGDGVEVVEPYGADALAATRRAITMCAAELARRKTPTT